MKQFQIDTDRLFRISEVLGRGDGDLSDCLAPDLKHVCELLAHICILQRLAPGFLDEVFSDLIPHFIQQHNRAMIKEEAQKRADASGFGDEWRAAIAAGMDPKKKDYLANLVAAHMKANGVNQAAAINAISNQGGLDPESVRRTVTRAKKRKK